MKKIYLTGLLFLAGFGLTRINAQVATFNYTPAMQTFVVPSCVTTLSVDVKGAAGGGNTVVAGGNGGRVTAVISVTPGQTYNIFVGGQGDVTGTAGYNGGGSGIGGSIGSPGSGGGGASDIRFGGIALANRIIVAGGGGGGTSNSGNAIGGAGGGLTGANGAPGGNGWGCTNTTVPTGGSQGAGGLGGTSTSCAWNGFNGSLGIGGNSYNNYRCAGGGGGYYGGGGAHNGMSGAGGSSYAVPTASSIVHTQGFQTGNGQVIITYAVGGGVSASASPSMICAGSSSTLTATAGALSYTWMPGNLSGATVAVNPTVTTTYSVAATFTGGCVANAFVTLTVNALPTVSASANNTLVCSGNSSTLTVTGSATNYSWSTGAITATTVVSPTVFTVYNVIGTNSVTGCSNTATVSVNVDSVAASISGPTAICLGQSATLSANGINTYSWSNGAFTSSIVISPTISSTYSVIGTNTLTGCTKSSTISVSVGTIAVAVAGTSSICLGQNATFTASGANTYSWNTGATTSTVSVSPAITSTYSVTGTNSLTGCSATSTISVIVDSVGVSITGASSICVGQSATLTASGANTYSWNTGPTSPVIIVTPSVTTSYTATGTSTVNGCSNTAVATIIVNPCTGIDQYALSPSELKIYPNPNNGEFTISANSEIELSVINNLGQTVGTLSINKNGNAFVKDLSPGIYFIVGQNKNLVIKHKIIVSN